MKPFTITSPAFLLSSSALRSLRHKKRIKIAQRLIGATSALLLSATVAAHEVPNLEHTHAFQKVGYGAYRQGHYVSGPTGSIIIWSPELYTGYPDDPPVQFARPRPISRAPGSTVLRPATVRSRLPQYGEQLNRD